MEHIVRGRKEPLIGEGRLLRKGDLLGKKITPSVLMGHNKKKRSTARTLCKM
jgi:hypothetical protein